MGQDNASSRLPEEEDSEPLSVEQLNELARLYPWMLFRQNELERMTRLPREAVSAAFSAPDFPSQFGRSRPEDLFGWVRQQDFKVQTKEVKKRSRA